MLKYGLLILAARLLSPLGFELLARTEVEQIPSDDGWVHLRVHTRGLYIGRRLAI